MKMRFKKQATIFFAGLLIILPAFRAHAAPASDDFCASLPAFSQEALSQVALAKKDFDSRKLGTPVARQSQKDQMISQTRATELSAANALFGSLDAVAATGTEKIAVKEFKKAVLDAIAARQSAVNEAMNAYRDGLAPILKDDNGKAAAALDAFQSSVEAALAAAAKGCAAEPNDPSSLRSDAKSALASAKAGLVAAAEASNADQKQIDALATKQKQSILRANQDYRGALNAAKRVLKKSFPEAFATTTAATSTQSSN